jgi:DNA-damage-inducible protein J
MAKTATINVRMEPEIKKQAEELFSVLGISLSDAFNMFACQAVRDHGIPFRVTADPPYADKLRIALSELERGESEVFTDTHAMFEQILAEGNDDV